MSLPPCFFSQSVSFVCKGSVEQLLLLQSCLCFLSPHPFSFLSLLLFHSFIFYCLDSNSHHIALELFLIITPLSASTCIPLASFSLGISLLSLPLSPCTPPYHCLSLCIGAFLPPPFFLLAHVCLSALPLLLPSSFSSFSLIFRSLSLASFWFPLQSLVMRCDKPCYHSNGFP